jgi:arsenite methyltransferase
MLPLHRIIWHETTTPAAHRPLRVCEPMTMEDPEQVRSYVKAYDWGGPASAVQLHHLKELAQLIRPGDTVLDLACGPGPLLLELATIYPDCSFIGADLSRPMLDHLAANAAQRGLGNVSTLCEDICHLPSLNRQVDVIISTSALHHLRSAEDVRDVFRLIRKRLVPGGGFYLFDFGALRSATTRAICVAEVARTAPPLTAVDYAMSLDAAFAIDEVHNLARDELPTPFAMHRSLFADFCYGLQSPPRTRPTGRALAHIREARRTFGLGTAIDHRMLRLLRRTVQVGFPRTGGGVLRMAAAGWA